MRWILAALGRAGRDDHGWTLLELLMAMTLGLIVLGAVVSAFVSQLSSANSSVSRSDSAQEVIAGMQRMTRDIRSATYITISASGNQIDMQTPERYGATSGVTKRVVYTCTTGTSSAPGKCTRDEGSAGLAATLSGNPKTVIDKIRNTNADVFTPHSTTFTGGTLAANPYVALALSVQVSRPGSRVVNYNDGVTLRNVPTS